MQTNYRRPPRSRQPQPNKQSHKLPLFVAIIIVLFAGGFFIIRSLSQSKSDDRQAAALTPTPPLESAALAWPADADAAVGTVENGLLAASPNQKPRPIASLAKVILALAILEKKPLELGETGPTFTFTREDVKNLTDHLADNGSVLPVLIGTELTEYQALQRILIASDNNVADKMARDIFGSQSAYLTYASNMLKQMDLTQTSITDPSGLDSQTVSTPSEMVTIGIAAMKNPVIAEIVAQKTATLPDIPGGVITNTNKLLGTNGIVGLKTGTTAEVGHCLLFAARSSDQNNQPVTIVGVVMNAKDDQSRYADAEKLLASVKQALTAPLTPTLPPPPSH